MTLLEEIASWDNKSATALQSTYGRYSDEDNFLATVLEHIADVELQRAATWLLKRHLEAGHSLPLQSSRVVLKALSDQEHWESQLHILQCLRYLIIPEDQTTHLESFLASCLESDNKFLRAWAYNGFNELALRFPRYRDEIDLMLARASQSEAASVRARIRNILKSR
jgi:hypothetical protein